MLTENVSRDISEAISATSGILRLDPAFVARDWLPPGRRLGLTEREYDVGERGFVCERWLASTTRADNAVGPDDEGLSYVRTAAGGRIQLRAAVAAAPTAVLGDDYAREHDGLLRLAKVFDFAERIPYHIHPRTEQAALVQRSSKDEAYYFPAGVEAGKHPESFFGVHPRIAANGGAELILRHLQEWDSADILQLARGYVQMPEGGFFIPSGILHAPGTALTVELQEDSDTLAMFQALNAGQIISKELLFKDVPAQERAERGEAALLDWIDWDANGDPYFHENHHIAPQVFASGDGFSEAWILYGTTKFSGKRLVISPGHSASTCEKGAFSLLVWQGEGTVGGSEVRAGNPAMDELLIVHDRATEAVEYVNTGSDEMTVIKFFGPDINEDAPMIPRYPADG